MKTFTYTVELSDEGFEKLRAALVEKNGEDPEQYSHEHIVYDELFIQLHSILDENNASGMLTVHAVKEDGSKELLNNDRF